VGQEPEDEQDLQQRLGAAVGEPQPGDAGAGRGEHRVVEGGERLGDADRVVAESLDAEQAPVGGEADLPQAGRLCSRFPIPKSRVSLMVVSVRNALPSLWYCLIAVYL